MTIEEARAAAQAEHAELTRRVEALQAEMRRLEQDLQATVTALLKAQGKLEVLEGLTP